MAVDSWNPILFPIAFVLLLHQPLALYLYYRRRDNAPVCILNPWNTGIANLGAGIFAFSVCVAATFQDTYPAAASILVSQSGMILCGDAFLVMAFSLFIVFNRAVGLASLNIDRKASSVQPGELNDFLQQLHWIRRLNFLLRKSTILGFLILKQVILLVSQSVYMATNTPNLYQMPLAESHGLPLYKRTVNIGVNTLAASVLVMIIISWKLRIVHDSLGMKQRLGRIGKGVLFGAILEMTVAQTLFTPESRVYLDVPAFIYIGIEQFIFTV